MEVNLSQFHGVPNMAMLEDLCDKLIEQSEKDDDPIFLSDLLTDPDTAEPLLAKLREDESPKYWVHFFRTKWGEDTKPGDKVTKRVNKSLYLKPGKPMPGTQQKSLMKAGQWDKKMVKKTNFTLNAKCCVKLNAVDALYFLMQHGIHLRSRQPLSYHPNETTSEPVDYIVDGRKKGKKTLWYWLCEEYDKDQYANAKSAESKPVEPKTGNKRPRVNQ